MHDPRESSDGAVPDNPAGPLSEAVPSLDPSVPIRSGPPDRSPDGTATDSGPVPGILVRGGSVPRPYRFAPRRSGAPTDSGRGRGIPRRDLAAARTRRRVDQGEGDGVRSSSCRSISHRHRTTAIASKPRVAGRLDHRGRSLRHARRDSRGQEMIALISVYLLGRK
jgi:hypothetical protein